MESSHFQINLTLKESQLTLDEADFHLHQDCRKKTKNQWNIQKLDDPLLFLKVKECYRPGLRDDWNIEDLSVIGKNCWLRRASITVSSAKDQVPPEDADAMDDFRESLIEARGRLSLLLLRSRKPTPVASSNFLGIWSWPKLSLSSSSDILECGFNHSSQNFDIFLSQLWNQKSINHCVPFSTL